MFIVSILLFFTQLASAAELNNVVTLTSLNQTYAHQKATLEVLDLPNCTISNQTTLGILNPELFPKLITLNLTGAIFTSDSDPLYTPYTSERLLKEITLDHSKNLTKEFTLQIAQHTDFLSVIGNQFSKADRDEIGDHDSLPENTTIQWSRPSDLIWLPQELNLNF